jgi:hypothetical protein
MDVDLRLNTLYRLLVGYSLVVVKGEEAARKFGAKPSEIERYKGMQLDLTRVYDTISLLSRWRQGGMALHLRVADFCRLGDQGQRLQMRNIRGRKRGERGLWPTLAPGQSTRTGDRITEPLTIRHRPAHTS